MAEQALDGQCRGSAMMLQDDAAPWVPYHGSVIPTPVPKKCQWWPQFFMSLILYVIDP